jgi:hypothetical protein
MRDAVSNIVLLTITASRAQRGITVSTPVRHLDANETVVLNALINEAITWANATD